MVRSLGPCSGGTSGVSGGPPLASAGVGPAPPLSHARSLPPQVPSSRVLPLRSLLTPQAVARRPSWELTLAEPLFSAKPQGTGQVYSQQTSLIGSRLQRGMQLVGAYIYLHVYLFYFERGDREQTREIFSPCQAEAESWVLHTGHPHGWWEHTCLNRHPLPPGVPMAGSWSGSGAGTLFQTISDAPTRRVTLRSPRSPPLDGSALRTAAQDHQVLDSPSWPHPCECHLCIY